MYIWVRKISNAVRDLHSMIGKDFVFTGEGRVREVEVLHYSKAGGQLEQGNAGLEFCTEVFHGFGLCSVSIPYDGTLCFSAAVSCRQEPVFLQGSSSSVQEQLSQLLGGDEMLHQSCAPSPEQPQLCMSHSRLCLAGQWGRQWDAGRCGAAEGRGTAVSEPKGQILFPSRASAGTACSGCECSTCCTPTPVSTAWHTCCEAPCSPLALVLAGLAVQQPHLEHELPGCQLLWFPQA